MKNFLLVFFASIFFVGCSKVEQHSHSIVEKDAIEYYGSVVALSDFPKNKLFDCNDIQSLTANGIGKSPNAAMVILAFDQDGVLFTAKRYNGELASVSSDFSISYCTDLQTFANVTGLKEANHQYAIPEGSLDNPYWIFDPYVRSFAETLKHRERVLQNKPLQSYKSVTPAWGLKGAILYANWSNGGVADYYGHIGTVSQSPSSRTSTDKWYCSKLAWAAYLYATGIDIDSNGGTIWPSDLRFSPQLIGMSFGSEIIV